MRDRARVLAIAGLIAVLAACTGGPTARTEGPPSLTPGPTADEGPTSPPPTVTTTQPNSYDLLNEALASGEIDDEQALVYKIFAAFDDPRLPAEYKGDNAELHDGLVVAEALARWESLSAETQATLAPFTLWPGEPESWLQLRVAGGPVAMAAPIALANVPILPVDGTNVRVWYREDKPADLAAAQSIVGMVDGQIWPKLTGLMGPPLSDLGLGNPDGNGEDARIDIVLTGESIRSFALLFACDETSGVIQLGVDGANLATVTHELMHVIESKYAVSTGCQWPEYHWLHEAVAQWSMDYVDPATQAERGTKTGLLPKACFLDVPGYPLDLLNDCHEYGAYLFFQYLARSYAPSYIPAVWQAAAGEDSLGAINSAVASAGGLAEVWPDFALAAYNVDPSKRFQQWDGLFFGARVIDEHVALNGASSREFTARGDVEHLAALYTGFRFEDPNIKKVTFSQPFTGNPHARVTAVVKFEGEGWKVEDWTPFPEKTFCYDDEGQKHLEQLVIIVSNSDPDSGAAALTGAQPKLTVADACAGAGFTGEITYKANCGPAWQYPNGCVTEKKATGVRFELIGTQGAVSYYQPVAGTVTDHLENSSAGQPGDYCTLIYDGTSSIPGDIYAQPNPSALGGLVGLRIDATDPEAPLYSSSSVVRMQRSISDDCGGSTLVVEINLSWIELSDPESGEGLPVTFEGKTWVLAGSIPSSYGGGPGLTWRFTGSP